MPALKNVQISFFHFFIKLSAKRHVDSFVCKIDRKFAILFREPRQVDKDSDIKSVDNPMRFLYILKVV